VWFYGKKLPSGGVKVVIVVHDFATHLPLSVIELVAKTLRQQVQLRWDGEGKKRLRSKAIKRGASGRILKKEGFEVAGVS
jgi:hypothetical protein